MVGETPEKHERNALKSMRDGDQTRLPFSSSLPDQGVPVPCPVNSTGRNVPEAERAGRHRRCLRQEDLDRCVK